LLIPDWFAAGDFNGDGLPDLLVVNRFGNFAVLLGRATP
jgi:hypothetical protein